MSNKVLKISIKVPQKSSLPKGFYVGYWGGNIIEVPYEGNIYVLETEEGIRGSNVHVYVTVGDEVTFEQLNN